ncbi:RNA helicase [Clostridium polyendosporum]|uniref:ATP-dependent RNA helicase CshA n=1 Tax=Clostridium polyendosporum TaxID=69208 RepID=A0A919S1P8_9CLOT|nr:DEAD/DEAH box helicase [Clostridium polyendosporum]GIM30172.1 RNA helicase [Clostridium polyendosporum]
MSKVRFSELNLSVEVNSALTDMGFEYATPIQAQSIPVILDGKDVFGQAQTGTGKTGAFAIPTIDKVDTSKKEIQVLVLCPTRELAIQVAEEFVKLAKHKKDLRILSVYGGDSMERQIKGIKRGVQIIVGTPGRVMDHMRRGTIKLNNLTTLVLDEADEMLNMGFRDDIEEVMNSIDQPIQKLLFSATIKPTIMDIIKKHLNNPEKIKIENKEVTTPNITQKYVEVKDKDKSEVVSRLLDIHNPKLSLIFCNTKMKVDELTDALQSRGYSADKIHGDMKQSVRSNVIEKFRQGDVRILIATDVAARGLDIDDVEMVFNYDVPNHEEYYVHRIGRTGRAGRQGTSFTLVNSRQMRDLRDIVNYTKKKMEPEKIPTLKDVEEVKTNVFIDEIKKQLEEGKHKKYMSVIEKLHTEGVSPIELAAAMLERELKISDVEEIQMETSSTKSTWAKDSGMARMFVNIGRDKKLRPQDLVKAIASETGIAGKEIGTIDIYDKYTFFEIPEAYANKVIDVMSKSKVKGVRINMELAQKKGAKGSTTRGRRKSN